ncbi:MAG TPA: hypothetical protein PLM71_11800 [Syntrophorhabdaceae bacterium]|mgnify:CR=1 FL=1|nr:hypothetical protein [Syntrophorhabdaceae bacterium]HPU30978.1 hypothetical protein [Syntrophorhabdaceae bacterium]
MPRINVDEVKPGMTTSKPVSNENGIIIIKENTELTDSIIDRLKKMGIEYIFVKAEKRFSKSKEDMLNEVEKRFNRMSNKPIMDKIKRIVREHIEELYDRNR